MYNTDAKGAEIIVGDIVSVRCVIRRSLGSGNLLVEVVEPPSGETGNYPLVVIKSKQAEKVNQ